MKSPFAFAGRIGRPPYALWSLGVFFSQHLAVLAVSRTPGRPLEADWGFYLMPLRSLVTLERPSKIYWLPLARWVVSRNNARVLDHIRRQAERGFRSANE
jgi:hypothetical protein